MKKTLTIDIPYFEQGTAKYKRVEISFISNGCIKEYNKQITAQLEYNKKMQKLDTFRRQADTILNIDIVKKQEEILLDLSKYNVADFNPFVIIKRILEDNSITDEDLLNYNFWYKQIDPKFITTFIATCIFKDIKQNNKQPDTGKSTYTLHEDRLIIALNKYWRPVDEEYYLKKMDIPDTNEAIILSQFPEPVEKRIWEKEKKIELFDFFKSYKG